MIDVPQLQEASAALPPDRVNPAPGFLCLYTAPGGQHCIIGEIACQLGLSVPKLDEQDNKVAVGYLAVKGRWAGNFTTQGVVWAAHAQLMGQLGYPWGLCVSIADHAISPVIPGPTSPAEMALLAQAEAEALAAEKSLVP